MTQGRQVGIAPLSDPTTREHVLHAYDLSLLSNAPNYDLRLVAERRRSAGDLADLFFYGVKAAQTDLFIEAGAMDARTSRRARRHLPEARIVAFEANPYVHERFRARNQNPKHRIEYLHLALSDTAGDTTLHLRKDSRGRPLVDGRGSLKEIVDHEHGLERVTVPSTTLDAVFGAADFASCALWVDVEGASEEVLKGAPQVLAKTQTLLVEVEDRDVWVWGRTWTASDVFAHLFDHGLIPVARDYQSRFQYNVLFVAPGLLRSPDFRVRLATHRSGAFRTTSTGDRQSTPGPEEGRVRALGRFARRFRPAGR